MAELAKIMIRDCKYDVSIIYYVPVPFSDGGEMICYCNLIPSSNYADILIYVLFYLQLDEIRQCKDCYNYSNAKPRDWFCQPCVSSHRYTSYILYQRICIDLANENW